MKNLIKVLTGSPDRIIATISLTLTIVGVLLSVIVYKRPEPLPYYLVTRDTIIVSMLVLTITILSLKYIKKVDLVERFRNILTEQLKSQHQMIHKSRDHFFANIRLELADRKSISPELINDLKIEYFRKVTHTVLTDTRELFLNYFFTRMFKIGDDVSVTVKITVDAEEAQQVLNSIKGEKADILNKSEKYIITGYRDPYTWEKKPKRNEVKQIVYRINEENTVFDEILNKDKGVYFCNNLQKNSIAGTYRNQNPNWQKSYNATLAVPIRYRHVGNQGATILYGVLAVDSLNPYGYDLFDEEITFNMLASSADVLAMMFGHLDMLQLTMELLENGLKS